MKKSFLLLILFLIFMFSSITFYMILNYLDPYDNKILAVIFVTFTFMSSISTFLALLLFFIKKIHYRGRVELYHIKTSFRQGFLVSLLLLWVIVFWILNAPVLILTVLLFIILILLELFIQNLDY